MKSFVLVLIAMLGGSVTNAAPSIPVVRQGPTYDFEFGREYDVRQLTETERTVLFLWAMEEGIQATWVTRPEFAVANTPLSFTTGVIESGVGGFSAKGLSPVAQVKTAAGSTFGVVAKRLEAVTFLAGPPTKLRFTVGWNLDLSSLAGFVDRRAGLCASLVKTSAKSASVARLDWANHPSMREIYEVLGRDGTTENPDAVEVIDQLFVDNRRDLLEKLDRKPVQGQSLVTFYRDCGGTVDALSTALTDPLP